MNFNPFLIGPSHVDHSRSTSIIKLEESGKIICPKCLAKTFVRGIEVIEETLFNSYVNNFFEILDQHGEKDDLRKTSLVILEALIKKNPIKCKSEHEFHNFLRILYKIMNSSLFNRNEFSILSVVLSNITGNFANFSSTHLVFTWKAYQHLLKYAEKDLIQTPISFSADARLTSLRFVRGISVIIKTYLNILSRFRISHTAELLLPLSTSDKLITHDRQQYINNQLECLNVMTLSLIPSCWPHFRVLQGELDPDEAEYISLFFETLENCFVTAVLLDNERFVNLVKGMDTLATAHNLMRSNRDVDFRKRIKAFLKCYTRHFIETELGRDKSYDQYMKQTEDIVETNHKNALFYSTDPLKHDKIKTYILINYIARNQNSSYYNVDRVKKVLKVVDPEKLSLNSSKVTMRAYNFLTAHIIPRVDKYDNILQFIERYWQKLRAEPNLRTFTEEYCYEGIVFKWTIDTLFRMLPEKKQFSRFISTRVIDYSIKRAIQTDQLHIYMPIILQNRPYRDQFMEYLKRYETADAFIQEVLKLGTRRLAPNEFDIIYDNIYRQLCNLLPAVLSGIVLKYNNKPENRLIDQIHHILEMIMTMMESCNDFDLHFDDRAIKDLFTFINAIYSCGTSSEKSEGVLVLVNELIAILMERNNPNLMKVLKKLDYYALGRMLGRIADYIRGDQVAESIARLLVAYANIDYPLRVDIKLAILEAIRSVPNWMFSKNLHLHTLSLRILKHSIMVTEKNNAARISICTGLLHMIVTNPELLNDRANLMEVLPVICTNELKYNPLLKDMLNVVSQNCRAEIKAKLSEGRPPSPTVSFSSGDSDDDDPEDDDINDCISNIVSQLHDDDGRIDESSRVPASLFVSSTIRDQHSATVDIEGWEHIAYETNKSEEDF